MLQTGCIYTSSTEVVVRSRRYIGIVGAERSCDTWGGTKAQREYDGVEEFHGQKTIQEIKSRTRESQEKGYDIERI